MGRGAALCLAALACASPVRPGADAGPRDQGSGDAALDAAPDAARDAGAEAGPGADLGPRDAASDGPPELGADDGAPADAAPDEGAPDACDDGRPRCATPGGRCEGGTLVVCAEDEDRCLVESRRDCEGLPGGSCSPEGPRCVLPPCSGVPAPCSLPGRRCEGDTLVVCAELASGCLAEERQDCATLEAGGRCDPARAACTAPPPDPCAGRADTCLVANRRCDGREELVVCAADAFGCLSETRTLCRTPAQPAASCEAGTLVTCAGGEACTGADLCRRPGARCDPSTGELVVCAPDAYDCLRERRTDCASVTRFATCVPGGVTASCRVGSDPCANVPSCRPEGRLCLGTELGICAPDPFGCLGLEVVRCGAAGRGCDPATLACR